MKTILTLIATLSILTGCHQQPATPPDLNVLVKDVIKHKFLYPQTVKVSDVWVSSGDPMKTLVLTCGVVSYIDSDAVRKEQWFTASINEGIVAVDLRYPDVSKNFCARWKAGKP